MDWAMLQGGPKVSSEGVFPLFSLSNSPNYLPNLFYFIFCVLVSGHIFSYLQLTDAPDVEKSFH